MELTTDRGPYHEFEYFDVDVEMQIQYQRLQNRVVLSDFVYGLFVPTFDWSDASIHELDRYGANKLFGTRAHSLARVLDGWLLILQQAPLHFSVSCGFDLDTNEQVFVDVDREALLATLRQIRAWAELSVTRGVLMHWGV